MKRLIALVFMIFVYLGLIVPEYSFTGEQDPITTIFLVRHAEKVGDGSADPALTTSGAARANELAYILKHVKLDAIYSTPYIRTKQTVLPTAKEKGLEVKLYKPGEEDFLKKVLQEFSGGTVLIVGHSNTVPGLANELAGQSDFSDLDDATYDNLFIACVPIEGKAVIFRMRFGAHTPEKYSPPPHFGCYQEFVLGKRQLSQSQGVLRVFFWLFRALSTFSGMIGRSRIRTPTAL